VEIGRGFFCKPLARLVKVFGVAQRSQNCGSQHCDGWVVAGRFDEEVENLA